MVYIIELIFLVIGFIFGKTILNQSKKNYDLYLVLLAAFFFIFGDKTVVFATSSFNLMISYIVPFFIAGSLLRRYMFKVLNSMKLKKLRY